MMNVLAGLAMRSLLAVALVPNPAESVKPALKAERFPWYDAGTGRVRPILPFEIRFSWLDRVGDWFGRVFDRIGNWFRWLNGWRVPGVAGAGDLVVIGLLMLFLTVVLVLLLELLRRYRPLTGAEEASAAVIRAGSAGRIEGLPAGVRVDAADPWNEAQRLRARGDYAGAIVYLFAHQLLTLDRAGRLRLVPGRTGRQLVRSVSDRSLRSLVEPTLRLFESVYYGQRAPSVEAFESVWASALQFQAALPEEAAV